MQTPSVCTRLVSTAEGRDLVRHSFGWSPCFAGMVQAGQMRRIKKFLMSLVTPYIPQYYDARIHRQLSCLSADGTC